MFGFSYVSWIIGIQIISVNMNAEIGYRYLQIGFVDSDIIHGYFHGYETVISAPLGASELIVHKMA